MKTVLGVLLALAILIAIMVLPEIRWRRVRRLVGFTIVGELPRLVRCPNCAHQISCFCVECRDKLAEKKHTR